MKRLLLAGGRRSGAWRVGAMAFGRHRLTVLAYHRVADPAAPGFVGYSGTASATPDEFARQVAWLVDRFHPVGLGDLARAVEGAGSLPPRPLLVTFDDGYRDNLTAALPVLERHGVPMTVFLATDHIGTDVPFWWDRAAWLLDAARSGRYSLPLLGEVALEGDRSRVVRHWIEAAKRVPDGERCDALDALPGCLAVTMPDGTFRGAVLDWDDVTVMSGRGVEFGAHTCSHPVLTRLPRDRAEAEIVGSVLRVGEATAHRPLGFAYPNGHEEDFDDSLVASVAAAGVPLGFTLIPGPARISEVHRRPGAIRRVYVHRGDDLDRLAAKVAGIPRLVPRLG